MAKFGIREKTKKNQSPFTVCHITHQSGDEISHSWYLAKSNIINGEFVGTSTTTVYSDTLNGLREIVLQMLSAIDEFQRKETE